MKVLFAVAGLVLLTASVAHADKEGARVHYQRGTTFFDLQKYGDAVIEYEKAFEAWDDPALLFNIGQAYRLAGNYKKSIGAYRSYLRRVHNASNRDEIQNRIATMQRALDTGTPIEAPPSKPATVVVTPPPPTIIVTPPPPVRAANPKLKWAGVGLLVGGGALIIAGGTFVGLAQSASNDITNAAPGTLFDPHKESTFKTDRIVGSALLAVGGVAAIGGGVLLALASFKRENHAQRDAPHVDPWFAASAQGVAFGVTVRR